MPYTPTPRANGQIAQDVWWNELQTAVAQKAEVAHTHAGTDITSGTVPVARIGTGTKDTTTFYRGDGTFATPAGSGSDVTVQDEGATLATPATTLNFVGAGVAASGNGAIKTITIPGVTGGGGTGGDTIIVVAAANASGDAIANADYVCAGTSGTDPRKDATKIMNAIAALPAAGGVIQLSEGTFYVKGTGVASDGAVNILRSNVTLRGVGIGATTILLDAAQGATDITGIVRTTSGADVSNVTTDALTIDGNKAQCTGRVIGWYVGRDKASTGYHVNMRIERTEVKNCYAYAIDPHERTKDLFVLDCWSHDNGGFTDATNTYGDGITIDWVQGYTIRGNLCHNNTRHGISPVTGALNGIIEGNRCYSNGENGIAVQLAGGMTPYETTVANNLCYANGNNGIYINKSDRILVVNNQCFTNASDGIRAYGAKHGAISGNICRDNNTAGTAGRAEIRLSSDGSAPRTTEHYLVSSNVTASLTVPITPYGIRVDDNVTNTYVHGNKVAGATTRVSISATGTTGTTQVANFVT